MPNVKASKILTSPFLYVTCVAKTTDLYQLSSCKCYAIRAREIHASMIDKLPDRKVMLLADRPQLTAKFADLLAPAWIEATSYSEIEVKY